ncbi:MAG: SufE family protein [Microbacteriaceae bacterium]
MTSAELPETLREIANDFAELGKNDQLQLLLEFSNELPELPEAYSQRKELFERVLECQSPVFLFVEVDADDVVTIHATAPAESPTTRGFASILLQGLNGLSAEQVLNVPVDYPDMLKISATVSPLRLRGMAGILQRIQRQVQEKRSTR